MSCFTLDKNLPYQLPVISECLAALESIQPQQVVRIGSEGTLVSSKKPVIA